MSATTSGAPRAAASARTSAASATCAEASIAAKVSRVIVAGCATARADVLPRGLRRRGPRVGGDRGELGLVEHREAQQRDRGAALAFVSSFM